MKDLIYLAITSLAMCAIIALYAHLVGFSKRAAFRDRKHAEDLMERYYPGKTISSLKLSADQYVALASFSDGTAGLVYQLGRKWVAHELERNSIKSVKTLRNGKLRIALHDFTAPGLTVNLADNTSVQSWLDALQPFMRASAIPAKISAAQ